MTKAIRVTVDYMFLTLMFNFNWCFVIYILGRKLSKMHMSYCSLSCVSNCYVSSKCWYDYMIYIYIHI